MNDEWLTRSRRAVWHPCTQMKHLEAAPPLAVARGEGAWLYDFEGRRYLDAISSWWVNLFGHANGRIGSAVKDQIDRLEHVLLAGCTHAPAVLLAERLGRFAPPGLGHCFYASDGASATEIALKMSFHSWRNRGMGRKTRFLCLQNGYHGETLGALSVTDVALFRDQYAPLLRQSAALPSPDWRDARADEGPREVAVRRAAELERALAESHADTAALILEPLVQCAGGMAMYDPEYLRQARALCSRYQVHLIADEIAVGFGRSGTLFACEQAGISPDILCLSKGLTGGYLPLSAVLATDDVYDAFYDNETARGFLHSHSYTGNPLACRAALATLDIFEQDDVINANRARAGRFDVLLGAVRDHPRVRDFRCTGMIWAFEVEGAGPEFAARFHTQALAKGLLLRPLGATVYVMPPYVVTDEEFELLACGLRELLDECR